VELDMKFIKLMMLLALVTFLIESDAAFALTSWEEFADYCKKNFEEKDADGNPCMKQKEGGYFGMGGTCPRVKYESCPALDEYINDNDIKVYNSWQGVHSDFMLGSFPGDYWHNAKPDEVCPLVMGKRYELYDEKCVKPLQIAKEQEVARAKIAACMATPSDECTTTIKACAVNPASNSYCNKWGTANENGYLGIKEGYEAKLAQTEAAKAQELAGAQKKAAGWNLDASKVLDELKAGKDPSTFKEGVEAVELGNLNSNQKGYEQAKARSDVLVQAIQGLAVAQKAAQDARAAADKPDATEDAKTAATAKEAELETAKQVYQQAVAAPAAAENVAATGPTLPDYPAEIKMVVAVRVIGSFHAAEKDETLRPKIRATQSAVRAMGVAVTRMRAPDAQKTADFIAEQQKNLDEAKKRYFSEAAQVKALMTDADKIKKWDEVIALVNDNWGIKPEEMAAAVASPTSDSAASSSAEKESNDP
jgi:hypothetical protein